METELQGLQWKFSRNMVILREEGRLVLINSIRLNEQALTQLDQLGKVSDVIRLGALHGRDDPFIWIVIRHSSGLWILLQQNRLAPTATTSSATNRCPYQTRRCLSSRPPRYRRQFCI